MGGEVWVHKDGFGVRPFESAFTPLQFTAIQDNPTV
jgi:hypothetical protein